MCDSVTEAIRVLNEVVAADELAMRALINYRVPCNKALAEHESVQVGTYHEASKETGYSVGILGIINGLFGVDSEGWGFIGADLGKDGSIIRFVDRRTV
ncbi:MAG: hypothetical protein WC503_01085 [Candidatus Shapirobacteria bacterium]